MKTVTHLPTSVNFDRPAPPRVVIVGGGLAGLAAAAALTGHDLQITLLESRPRLGGRAGSFVDPASGELVDNCQHVGMACCVNLIDFCERVGVADLFKRDPVIVFVGPDRRVSKMSAGRIPAPFHLTASMLKLSFLTFLDKLRIAYGMARLRFDAAGRPGETFESWLKRHAQNDRTIERFWGSVLVSALNERLDRMDIFHARKVFFEGFLENRQGYALDIPAAPLGEIYGVRMEEWLARRGVEVRLKTGVKRVEIDHESSVQSVILRSGERLEADFVIVSVPFDRIADMFQADANGNSPAPKSIESIEASPITGVHLWFDKPVFPFAHAAIVGKTIQWVFNHTELQGREPAGQYLQVVISASYDLVGRDNESIKDLVLQELSELWPEASGASLKRYRVVIEHGATFAVRPGIEALRPPQRTAVDGLFFAGDWTDTGWPATMEGAVRSGYLAAEGVLDDLGRARRLLKPDLPAGALARFLLGRKPVNRTIPGESRSKL